LILDLVCLAVLSVAAVSGAFGGALRQLAKLGAAGLALAGTRLLAPSVAAAMASALPRPVVGPLASAATFAALYVLLGLVLGILARAAHAAGAVPGSLDRGAGALLGGAKAGLVLWVLVSALVAWGRPLPFLGAALDAPSSDFAAFARDHGAFGPRGGLRHLPASLGGEPRSARERREAAAADWRGAGEQVR
jgi:membrane protein required for colicin V production